LHCAVVSQIRWRQPNERHFTGDQKIAGDLGKLVRKETHLPLVAHKRTSPDHPQLIYASANRDRTKFPAQSLHFSLRIPPQPLDHDFRFTNNHHSKPKGAPASPEAALIVGSPGEVLLSDFILRISAYSPLDVP